MAAASVENSENMQVENSSAKENDVTVQVSENVSNKVKLTDMKVADLRIELEKRELDKSGVKSVLIERLKAALVEEGEDVEELTFNVLCEAEGTKNSSEKREIPSSETNGDLDNKAEHESAERKDLDNNTEHETNECKERDNSDERECKDLDNNDENAELECKDSDSAFEDKVSNEVTLQISIDEEEAQLNEDDGLELHKVSDNENDKIIEETKSSNCEASVKESPTSKSQASLDHEKTPSRISKVMNEESKEVKASKTSSQLKTSEATSTVSPRVLKVIGKSDKIKSANVLAKSLWVTGLPNTTRAADLKALFSKEGKVSSVKIVKSTKQTPGKCYGFVTMAASKDATKAIQNLHRTELNGRIISVERTQSEPSALLKKTESKVIALTARKPAAKKDVSKATESVKQSSTSETKASAKPETKSSETKSSSEQTKVKEKKAKSVEKAKSKEKDSKSREHKDREVRRPAIKRAPPSYRSRPFSFNDRPRYGTFRQPFGSRPYRGRSGFGSAGFRPGSEVSLYEKMREERIRREKYRERREADRRRAVEISHHRYIERKQREEAFRLEREKEKLRIEREILERERAEIIKLEREKQRLERERLEREREELRRQAELRRSTKRPFSRTSREVDTFWMERKKAPRYEERSSFHSEKLRLDSPSGSRYEFPARERGPSHRHEFDRHPERFGASKTLHTTPRSDFGDRDSRREVTIRSREERPVYERGDFRDRDSRRSFPSRERHSARREGSREDWKHDRRVHERIVAPSTSTSQRRMTYY